MNSQPLSDLIKNKSLYTYRAHVSKVYDGDTITVTIELGFNAVLKGEKLRLFGINAPEVRGDSKPEGIRSRDWLRNRILNKDIVIKTIKDKKGKYGRYLAVIYLGDININDELVSNGFAVYKDY